MTIRLITLVALLVFGIGCAEQPTSDKDTKQHTVELIDGDIVATFKHRHDMMRSAMEQGNVELAEKISAQTNAWLETLSYEEQTLISRSLEK